MYIVCNYLKAKFLFYSLSFRVTLYLMNISLRVPAKLKYFVFEILAKLVCIKLNLEKVKERQSECPNLHQCSFCLASQPDSNVMIPLVPPRVEDRIRASLEDRISASLDLHHRRQEEEDRRTEIKTEWQHCALVIDR